MSAYLIVDVDVTDPEAYATYRDKVPRLIAKHGGVYLVRGGSHEVIEGDWQPHRLVLLQFPDPEAARAFIEDPDYTAIKAIRLKAAHSNTVLVEGFDAGD